MFLPRIYSFLLLLGLASAQRLAFQLADRASGGSAFCPVACGDGWCCDIGQSCQPKQGNDVPYQCDDFLLDTTLDAYQDLATLLGSVSDIVSDVSSFISSLTHEHSLTLTFSTVTALATTTSEPALTSSQAPIRPTAAPTTSTTPAATNAANSNKKLGRAGSLVVFGLGLII